ncbi:MAG: hypothetical protein NTU76_03010 [Candidatus Taylorbacteria bacterium]|nr:hypothetical protein [Candidatus Taylorbacteria bacterium]
MTEKINTLPTNTTTSSSEYPLPTEAVHLSLFLPQEYFHFPITSFKKIRSITKIFKVFHLGPMPKFQPPYKGGDPNEAYDKATLIAKNVFLS